MCKITSTELKNNLSYYLELSSKEDVIVTKNNRIISVLINPKDRAFKDFMELEGCMKSFDDGKDYKEIIGDEIYKKCGY